MSTSRTRELATFTALLPQRAVSDFRTTASQMAENCEKKWWAWQGLNLRPLRCQGRAPNAFPLKTAVFDVPMTRTAPEQMRNLTRRYRTFAASPWRTA